VINYPRKGHVQNVVTSLNFGKCDNVSKTMQDRDIVVMEDYWKSYVAHRMSPLPVTLNDLEGHFYCLKLF